VDHSITVHQGKAHALIFSATLLSVAGCGSISPERMVPAEAAVGTERKIALRVRVMPATGARDTTFGGPAFPNAQQYHEALLATLQKAGIFAGVSATAGDIELATTLLTLDQQGFIPYTVRMVANYRFTSRDGATLWSETYDSTFSASNLGGATRTLNANEGAVRENLKALVQGIRERWRP
jgi:hypothetical protein